MITRRIVLTLPIMVSACAQPNHYRWVEGQQPLYVNLPGHVQPMRMWLALPRGYLTSTVTWPLVVFLHGSGERGNDLQAVKLHGPPKLAEQGIDYPFILVSPQLEADAEWSPDAMHALLVELLALLHIDPARVLATGLSLGGHGVWNWAAAYPQDLAGIAPVCGFGNPLIVCDGLTVPVRAYHGAADEVVPVRMQLACVEALRACGGAAEITIYPGVGHDAWNLAYQDPSLVTWLTSQMNKAKR